MREFLLFGDLWVQFSLSKSVHHIEKIVIIRREYPLGIYADRWDARDF